MTTDTKTKIPSLTLNDGREMPQLGFGTWQIDNDDATGLVETALDIGYPLVDTAAAYQNEKGVGAGLQGRDDIWLTTKVWNAQHGFDEAKKALDNCLGRLGRDSVDLVLIHWPCPEQDKYVDTWKAFIELRDEGKAKSIGVSNFLEPHLERIIAETGVTPAVNQIEIHPAFQQRGLQAANERLGIVTQAWSPLGMGDGLENEVIEAIARETDRPASAVIIAWHMQQGRALFPKASSREHMEANFEALEFELSEAQLTRIDALDREDGRMGPDPREFEG